MRPGRPQVHRVNVRGPRVNVRRPKAPHPPFGHLLPLAGEGSKPSSSTRVGESDKGSPLTRVGEGARDAHSLV
ncbi:hypothetical protein AZ78_1715 [Lysobacter capsici AZ78]|uniref:Uncharacterized protein n=1 Tax=Lysobacter capsici AZ78 TaxID=1444315 RepID=A0A108U7U5_9GAMM|nr:hypothetical protein AZ78_1715 [Lysobacter capsici AZ78]